MKRCVLIMVATILMAGCTAVAPPAPAGSGQPSTGRIAGACGEITPTAMESMLIMFDAIKQDGATKVEALIVVAAVCDELAATEGINEGNCLNCFAVFVDEVWP